MANGVERKAGGRLFREPWFHVGAYVMVIFALSLQPGLQVPGTFEYRDKFAHLLEYGGLGWLVFRAAVKTWPATGSVRRALLTILAVSALGACDEKLQAGVPGRDSTVSDWIADTVGVSLSQALCLALGKRPGGA